MSQISEHDALGRRIERAHTVVGSGTTTDTWVYDDKNVIAQNRNAVLYQEYVHRGGLDTPLAMLEHSASVTAYYYQRDALGTVRALTDAAEAVAQSYTYSSYGATTVGNPTGLDQPFRYTAREWDAAASLYYYRARYYDQTAGRFLSQDPIRHRGGLNLYAYVGGNPVNALDPAGLAAEDHPSDCCEHYEDWTLDGHGPVDIQPNVTQCNWSCQGRTTSTYVQVRPNEFWTEEMLCRCFAKPAPGGPNPGVPPCTKN